MAELLTERLVLRPTDPTYTDFIARLQAREGVDQFLGRLGARDERDVLFTVVREGVKVGQVGLVKSDALDGEDFELVCALLPEAEGCGIATEACAALTDWAFTAKPWPRIIACINNHNKPALELARRLELAHLQARAHGDETVFVRNRPAALPSEEL